MTQEKKDKYKEYEKKYTKKTIKFLVEDYKLIEKKLQLSGLDFSNYTKHILLKSEVIKVESQPLVNDDIYTYIKSISNNINQITKTIHTSIALNNEPLVKSSLVKLNILQRDISQFMGILNQKKNDNKR